MRKERMFCPVFYFLYFPSRRQRLDKNRVPFLSCVYPRKCQLVDLVLISRYRLFFYNIGELFFRGNIDYL